MAMIGKLAVMGNPYDDLLMRSQEMAVHSHGAPSATSVMMAQAIGQIAQHVKHLETQHHKKLLLLEE